MPQCGQRYLRFLSTKITYGFVGCYALTVHNGESKIVNKNGYLFIADNGVNYLFDYVGNETNLLLPDNYNGENYQIYNYAFYERKDITSVTIPDSVTSIGEAAFYNCDNLQYNEYDNALYLGTSVTIPNSVTSIGDYAFYDCSGLTSITIPDSVTSIGEYAFRDCSGLSSVTIPDSVTSIGYDAFEGCSGLTSITIPDSVTFIGGSAFEGCSGLTSVTIPASVTSIGGSAFKDCNNLENIYITDVAAWCNISGLDGIMYYGSSNKKLYLNNELITNLVIPNSVTSIGDYAFYGCSGFTGELVIPNSVTSISRAAFYNCSGLTGKLVIPNSITSIDDFAFYGCSGLTSITIPASVTSIGYAAFYNCSGLTSVTIPNSVTSIGDYAFSGCSGLESITVASGNANYHNNGNCLIETATKTLILGCKNSVIPANGSVTFIGDGAFYGCSGLTSITIPDSVTSICFGAFSGCSGLTSLTIPASVTHIGDYAFSGCSGLESITVVSGNTKYHSAGNCLIETATKKLIAGCKNGVIPSDGSVTSIGSYAFEDCSELTSVTIPDSVTSIEDYAFEECIGLAEIKFNGTVAEWNAITKGEYWNKNVPATQVICSDGTIDL